MIGFGVPWTRLRVLPSTLGCLVFLATGLLIPAAAHASVAISSFTSLPSSSQAGGHPNFLTRFVLSSHQTLPNSCACNDAKDVTAHLPAGLIGNPHATPQCDIAQFASNRCPVDSQVGVAVIGISALAGKGGLDNQEFLTPVYNMIPPPTQPGLLAFKSGGAFQTPTFEDVSARTDSDYGLDVSAYSIEHIAPLTGVEQLTWGVPAAPSNDNFRFGFGQTPIFFLALFAASPVLCDANGNPSTANPASIAQLCAIPNQQEFTGPAVGEFEHGNPEYEGIHSPEVGPGYPIPSESPLTPFIQNPTTCGLTSLASSLEVLSYDRGMSFAESTWPATTDCAPLTFNPSQSIEPTTTTADSPSGAEFRLTVPQFESPSVPSPSELRAATVTLPAGFALAPNVMNGKTTCSAAEARFGTTEEANCPENAKLGTITVDTPVLPGPLGGGVYLGEPQPGNRYRMFLVFDGFGVHVKLPGTVTPDPQTGQIHISFSNLPQAPFETFNMHVFGSERGPLATPTQCGTYEVSSEWTPWDSALSNQTSRQFFTIDRGPNGRPCPSGPRPFDPGFQAASDSSAAGAHTSFSASLTRSDGEQNLKALSLTTPPGFSASLKGIPYCSSSGLNQLANPLYSGFAELASPICAASLLGTATAGVGAGTHPLYLPGRVYLAGPYRGAPLSLVVVIPAVSGPYDLGNVAVRAAIHVNPSTAQVTTVSDPLPQIVGGIPIRTRQILVNLDRPGFALNPTNCEPFSVNAQLSGDEGVQANLASRFQVGNCASLPYQPKLSLSLNGGLRRRGHPAIHAFLTTKPGEANTSRVSLALPKGEILDNAHIQSPCTRVALNANLCPAGSVLGHAKATTPLLDQPLEGPVYLTTGFGHKLPDLVVDLGGQIHIQLDGMVDTTKGGSLRTTFQTVPDAPVSTFTLDLLGGSRGLVQNTESLCDAHFKARLSMSGQNGAFLHRRVPLKTACGGAKKREKHKRGSGR